MAGSKRRRAHSTTSSSSARSAASPCHHTRGTECYAMSGCALGAKRNSARRSLSSPAPELSRAANKSPKEEVGRRRAAPPRNKPRTSALSTLNPKAHSRTPNRAPKAGCSPTRIRARGALNKSQGGMAGRTSRVPRALSCSVRCVSSPRFPRAAATRSWTWNLRSCNHRPNPGLAPSALFRAETSSLAFSGASCEPRPACVRRRGATADPKTHSQLEAQPTETARLM